MINRCQCSCHEPAPLSPEEAAWRQRQREARERVLQELQYGLLDPAFLAELGKRRPRVRPEPWRAVPQLKPELTKS